MSDPPIPDNTLPGDLPLDKPPGVPDQTLPHELRRQALDQIIRTPLEYLKALYPKYFSPDPIDPDVIEIMLDMAYSARPSCLPIRLQNVAQAHYAAYLLDQRLENTSTEEGGTGGAYNSGIILSEKEGDLSVTYADPRSSGSTSTSGSSGDQPSSAWEKWKQLWDLCALGAITTRYGRPNAE